MAKQQKRRSDSSVSDNEAQPGTSTAAATLDRERVAQRAYELYLARGGADGQELDDWLCAEREVRGDEVSTPDPTSADR